MGKNRPVAAETWDEAWSLIWGACVRHAGMVQDAAAFDALGETADGSPERVTLLRALIGPLWREEFDHGAFTEEYEECNAARFGAQTHRQPHSLDEQPERKSLDALISAWRAGPTRIVIIPCHGSYTCVIGEHARLLTNETRDDQARYAQALRQFGCSFSTGLLMRDAHPASRDQSCVFLLV